MFEGKEKRGSSDPHWMCPNSLDGWEKKRCVMGCKGCCGKLQPAGWKLSVCCRLFGRTSLPAMLQLATERTSGGSGVAVLAKSWCAAPAQVSAVARCWLGTPLVRSSGVLFLIRGVSASDSHVTVPVRSLTLKNSPPLIGPSQRLRAWSNRGPKEKSPMMSTL